MSDPRDPIIHMDDLLDRFEGGEVEIPLARAVRPIGWWAQRIVTMHEFVRKLDFDGDIAYDRSNIDSFGLNAKRCYSRR